MSHLITFEIKILQTIVGVASVADECDVIDYVY